MRTSGKLLSQVIQIVRANVAVGVTPADLDRICAEEIMKRGAISSFKGYKMAGAGPEFPATVCISKNNAIVHGIPDNTPFEEGDLVSLDFGLSFQGYHADAAFTVYLEPKGQPDLEPSKLLLTTEDALKAAIAIVKPGCRVGDIGHAVQQKVLEKRKEYGIPFGIVHGYGGHGIGRKLHESPFIPNIGKKGRGALLRPGSCICIEPMITGGSGNTKILDDNWTVVTEDDSYAAHFEHTLLITDTGVEVLTL